jgi:hypothetical protein
MPSAAAWRRCLDRAQARSAAVPTGYNSIVDGVPILARKMRGGAHVG